MSHRVGIVLCEYTSKFIQKRRRNAVDYIGLEVTEQNAEFERNFNGLRYVYTRHDYYPDVAYSVLNLEVSPEGA